MRKYSVSILLVTLLVGSRVALAAPPAFAIVTVLHGLPAVTADVYINGVLTLDGFEPKSATDPLELPPGDYHIEIRDVGAAADSPPVLEGSATIKAGQNISIIAGLSETGDRILNVFPNDQSAVGAGKIRLVARHAAAAAPLDVRIDGTTVLSGIGNAEEATRLMAAGTHSVEFTEAGSDDVLIGPLDVAMGEGTEQILYAVGSKEEQSLDVMTQTLTDLQSDPTDVNTGDGGLAATGDFPAYAVALMAIAGVGFVVSSVWLLRNRRSRHAAPNG